MKRFYTIILVAISGLLAAASVRASVITISPFKDNTLYQDDTGATSNGSGNYLFAGVTDDGGIRRAVMAFDVAGNIPAGSTINSVSLTMNMSRCGPTCFTQVDMGLHALQADWGEGASMAGGQEGFGAPAAPGDATWLNTFYPSAFWTSPGGDFSPTVSASQLVSSLGDYTWSTTGQMVADVQSWLDSPASNFGWLLMGGEDTILTAKRFNSRANPNVTGPRLTIDYSPIPEPSTILFLSAGTIVLCHRRRAH